MEWFKGKYYLLGSTLQNPALVMTHPVSGAPMMKYSPISPQKRACSMTNVIDFSSRYK